MAAPTPLGEDFISCVGSTVTVGSGMDTWIGTVTDGGLTHTYEIDDMTNNEGAGAYEDVKTTYKWEGDVTIAWRLSSPPPMQSGDIFHVVIAAPTGGPTITGNFRFNGFNYPVLSPKAGLKLKGKLTGQGAIVRTISA